MPFELLQSSFFYFDFDSRFKKRDGVVRLAVDHAGPWRTLEQNGIVGHARRHETVDHSLMGMQEFTASIASHH